MSALELLGVLIGTWQTRGTHPEVDVVVTGVTTFEWLSGEHFLIQRSQLDDERFPDAISVYGPNEAGDGLVMEYFDSRGVRRTYGVAIEDGVLRTWRDAPGFQQRSTTMLAPDAFEWRSELARSPGEWREDLVLRYERLVTSR